MFVLSFFITLINLDSQIRGTQTWYTVVNFGHNQPLDLCGNSDANIVMKRAINLKAGVNDDMPQKNIALKSDVSFMSCITKINCILIESLEDLDIVMLMYNMLEYNYNYYMSFTVIIN